MASVVVLSELAGVGMRFFSPLIVTLGRPCSCPAESEQRVCFSIDGRDDTAQSFFPQCRACSGRTRLASGNGKE